MILSKVFFFALVSLFVVGCKPANLLHFRYYPKKKEFQSTQQNKHLILNQEFRYDDPSSIDEEITTFFSISIKDSIEFIKNKKVNVVLNDSIVSTKMGVFCFGCIESTFFCHGEIELLKWSKRKIKIRENIFVTNDSDNLEVKQLKGKRTFIFK